MAAVKVKVGDTVLVRAGKDKGLRGTVLKVDRENDRVTVEGVNRVYRHQKSIPGAGSQNQVGGIITREAPIHISNVTRVEDAKKSDKKADKASKKAEKAEKAEKSEKKAGKASASDAAEVTDEKKVDASAEEDTEAEVVADETPAAEADETAVAEADDDASADDAEKKDES